MSTKAGKKGKKESTKSPEATSPDPLVPAGMKADKETKSAAQRVLDRQEISRASQARAIPTPASAPLVAAVDVAAEKRRTVAEQRDHLRKKAAFDAFHDAKKDRQEAAKKGLEAARRANPGLPEVGAGDTYVVSNPSGEFLEFSVNGESFVLAPGDNEFDDLTMPGLKGSQIADGALTHHSILGVHSHNKSAKERVNKTEADDTIGITQTGRVGGSLDYPAAHYEQIKDVSDPPASERAQPLRFPDKTEHDPQGVRTATTKQHAIDLINSTKAKK